MSGNASGAPMWDVSGTTGAAPIWAALMNYLHQTQTSRAPQPPGGVVQAPVQFAAADAKTGRQAPLEAARLEWFLQGTQQATFAINSGATQAGFTWAPARFDSKLPLKRPVRGVFLCPSLGPLSELLFST